jgi:hypothetical protein
MQGRSREFWPHPTTHGCAGGSRMSNGTSSALKSEQDLALPIAGGIDFLEGNERRMIVSVCWCGFARGTASARAKPAIRSIIDRATECRRALEGHFSRQCSVAWGLYDQCVQFDEK